MTTGYVNLVFTETSRVRRSRALSPGRQRVGRAVAYCRRWFEFTVVDSVRALRSGLTDCRISLYHQSFRLVRQSLLQLMSVRYSTAYCGSAVHSCGPVETSGDEQIGRGAAEAAA